jgi:hypothetical protein
MLKWLDSGHGEQLRANKHCPPSPPSKIRAIDVNQNIAQAVTFGRAKADFCTLFALYFLFYSANSVSTAFNSQYIVDRE